MPDTIKDYTSKIGELIFLKWKNNVETDSRKFVILYVPRDNEWEKPTNQQDSWKSWLISFCNSNDILLIDPTESFHIAHKMNKNIYDDHFTQDGHKAFADAFTKWFMSSTKNSQADNL
jgi:hypothetical protein